MTDANRIKQVSGWIEEAMNDPDNFSPLNIAKEISAIYLTEHKTRVACCKYCGEWFKFERSTKSYCSGNCRRLAFYHREKSKAKGGAQAN